MGLERHDAIYTYLQGQNSAPALKREAARIGCKIGRVCTCMYVHVCERKSFEMFRKPM